MRAFLYILKSILLPFMMCMLAFFSLIFTFQFLQSSGLFFQDSSSLTIVLEIFTLLGISYLPLIIPFCLLFGILFGHGRLSSQSEFTAFASFGISKWKLAQPAIFFSFVCLIICFNSIHTWGPNAKFKAHSLEAALKQKVAVTAFQPGVFLTQVPGITIYAEDESADKTLKNILIINEKNDKYEIFSKSGRFVKENTATNLGINLFNGQIYSNPKANESNMVISFKKYFIQLFKAPSKNITLKNIRNRSSKQLKRLLKLSEFPESTIYIELNKRAMFVFSCVFFLVLGSLFSLRLHDRSSKGGGFFTALAISMLFWVSLFASESYANSMKNPLIMYTPVLICSLFCLFAYRWIKFKSII